MHIVVGLLAHSEKAFESKNQSYEHEPPQKNSCRSRTDGFSTGLSGICYLSDVSLLSSNRSGTAGSSSCRTGIASRLQMPHALQQSLDVRQAFAHRTSQWLIPRELCE